MSCSQFGLTTSALLIIGLALLTSPVLGQEVSPLVFVPCAEGIAPGLPTLKLRQRAPRNSSSPSVSSPQPPQNEDCGDPDVFPNIADEPEVRFEGLHAFTAAEALKLFRERRVSLPKDHILAPEVLAGAVTVLKESLEARGYVQASVEARHGVEANTIVLLVSEGPRFSIREIRFEGNRIFSSQDLAARMREFLRSYENSKNLYDAEIFDVCLRRLTNFVKNRGYLQARLGEPKKELIEGELVVTVPVEEGALYRLGEIKIEGAENFTQQQVRAMLSLRREDITNGEAIGKWLYEDLKKLFGEMGYIQYTAEIDPEFRLFDQASQEGVVDFKVTIDEGRQFRIRSIKFDGSHVPEKELRHLLLINSGDVFNQLLLEKSVNQLNKTEWFETIDKDKDTDFRTDEEEALLDITIRLKRVKTR